MDIGGTGNSLTSSSYDDFSSHEEKDQNLETNKEPVDQTTPKEKESQKPLFPNEVKKVFDFKNSNLTKNFQEGFQKINRKTEATFHGTSLGLLEGINKTTQTTQETLEMLNQTMSSMQVTNQALLNSLVPMIDHLSTQIVTSQQILENQNKNTQQRPTAPANPDDSNDNAQGPVQAQPVPAQKPANPENAQPQDTSNTHINNDQSNQNNNSDTQTDDQTNPAASNLQNAQSQGTDDNHTEPTSGQGNQNNIDTNHNTPYQAIGNLNIDRQDKNSVPTSNSQQPNSAPTPTSTAQPVNNDNNNVDDNASGIDLAGVFKACKNIDTYIKNNGRGTVPPGIENLTKRINARIKEKTKGTSLFEQAKGFVSGKGQKKIKLLRAFGLAGDIVGIQYGDTKSTFHGTDVVSSSTKSDPRADNYELLKTLKEELGAQTEDANPRYEIDPNAGTLTIRNGEEKITYYFPVPLDPGDLIAIIRGPDGNIALNPDEIKVVNSGTSKLKKRIREAAQDENDPNREIWIKLSHAIDGMSSNVPQSGDKPDNNKYLITNDIVNMTYIQTNENNLFKIPETDQPDGDQLNESRVQEILQKTYNISNPGAFLNTVERELRRNVPQQSATSNVQPQNEENAASNNNNAANAQSNSEDAKQFAERIMYSYNAMTAQRFEDQNRARITAFLTNLHKKKKEEEAQLATDAAGQNNNEVARLSDAQIRTIISKSLPESSNSASASNPANSQQNPGTGSGEAGQNIPPTDAASGNGGNQQRQDQAAATQNEQSADNNNEQTSNNGIQQTNNNGGGTENGGGS